MEDKNITVGSSEVTSLSTIGASSVTRLEKTKPDDYRLGLKPNGALVLQGYFTWRTATGGGGEWRDLPTVVLDE